MLFFLLPSLLTGNTQLYNYGSYPVYQGKDLGLTYTPQRSFFRIWAPTAERTELLIYKNATSTVPVSRISMRKADAGTWTAAVMGDQKKLFYTFRVIRKIA